MAIPLLVLGGLAALSVGGQILSAEAQANAIRAQAEFQAKIAELNAQMAEIDSVQVLREGRTQEARYLGEVTQVQDAQTAAFATQGVEVKGDATGDLVAQSSLAAALNLVDMQNQAAINSSKYKREADQIRNQSALNTYNASNYARSTLISGYAGALTSAANFAIQGSSLMGKGSSKLNIDYANAPTTDIRSGVPDQNPYTASLSPTQGHNHWNNFYG